MTAHREPSLSEPARTAMNWLECLTQGASGHAGGDTLDVDGAGRPVRRRRRGRRRRARTRPGLVTRTADGIASTGKDWDRPHYPAAHTTFAYDLDDDVELTLPHSWAPTVDAPRLQRIRQETST